VKATARDALDRVGAWGAQRVLGRAQRIFHRQQVALTTVGRARVLVVAPHMDDEVIGPGGAVLLHVAAGSQVGVVFASDGAGGRTGDERDEYVGTRRAEATAAADEMGTEIVDFLDHPDGELPRREGALAADLQRVIASFGPERIYAPFPTDHHRDHQATAAALASAVASGWDGDVWTYEAWSPLWPNVAVDVTGVLDTKVAALRCHRSQLLGLDYEQAIVGLNRYRGLRVGVACAEAFYAATAPRFVRVTRMLTGRI
jgi:N-acetylglucosamine malate deacetylase 1